MKPPPFDYVAPDSVEEVLGHLAYAGADAAILAGGQTLTPLLALRLSSPALLIDINRIAGFQGIAFAEGGTRVMAGTRQNDILGPGAIPARLRTLLCAVRHVGHHQTRNRGTIGGSIALGEPAAELPATAVALEAMLELRSSRGARIVAAREFYIGPYTTVIEPDELLVSITFPDWPGNIVPVFGELARRPGDFALVGLTGALAFEQGRISRAGLAWFGMGEMPLRCTDAEEGLLGCRPSDVDVDAVAALALLSAAPMDDLHATAQYRQLAGRTLFKRAIMAALAEGDAV